MDDERTIRTDVELAIADAEWRHEVAEALGRQIDDGELILPAYRGEAGTTMRRAFEERQRAFQAWRAARGVP